MELSKILELRGSADANEYDKLKQEMLKGKTIELDLIDKYIKQYDPELHDVVTNLVSDPNKIVDSSGGTKEVPVSRLPIPLQKMIVKRRAGFLCGKPIQLDCNANPGIESNMLKLVQKVWDDNKLDFESKKLAKLMMMETEVAELWYPEPVDAIYWRNTPLQGKSYRLRMRVLSNRGGDTLIPTFNKYGDMIAFGRAYKLHDDDGKEIEHYDVYTDKIIYEGYKDATGNWVVRDVTNQMGKIPVIYYSQDLPEWADVQRLITRYETAISNHADTNDYFSAPIVKMSGKVVSFSDKDERGKMIEMEAGGDAEYLSWDNTPESMKLEYSNLRSLIMDMTDTPDISFEAMSKLGQFSGIALRLLFMGAHMAAADKEETFGVGVQRRINLIKSTISVLDDSFVAALPMAIKPKFTYYLPDNFEEMINILSVATGSQPIMSQETAVRLNKLIEDPTTELTKIKNDRDELAKSAAGLEPLNPL